MEFRARMVELFHAGKSAESLACEFAATAQTIRNWAKQAELDEGTRVAVTQPLARRHHSASNGSPHQIKPRYAPRHHCPLNPANSNTVA
jgi:transposase-like protein